MALIYHHTPISAKVTENVVVSRGVSLWVGVGVNPLQRHDVINGFLHFVRVDAECRLQQLESTGAEENRKMAETARRRWGFDVKQEHGAYSYCIFIEGETPTSFLENLRDDSGRRWLQKRYALLSFGVLFAPKKSKI